jgi:membrane protease YdiL (CAAX protease family)
MNMMNEFTDFQDFPPARKVFSRIGFVLLTIIAVATVLQIALAFGLTALSKDGAGLLDSSWIKWLLTFAPIYGVAVPVGLALFGRLPAQPPESSKLGVKNSVLFLLMCFPMMYCGNIIGTLLSYFLSGGTAENARTTFVTDNNALKIAVLVILAPCIEEYVFRKQIIDRSKRYGEKTAIFLSAFTFALFHGNLYQFFYALGLGWIFAYVYTRTGRIRYTMILHGVINALGSVAAPWVLSLLDLDALSRHAEDMSTYLAANESVIWGLLIFGLYFLAMIGLSIAGLVILLIKKKHFVYIPADGELERGQRFRTVFLNPGMILYTLFCLGMVTYYLI